MKAAKAAALCWVFSIVQRKDRPSRGTALQGVTMGGAGRLSGKPERNAVPMKGDTMGMARPGNRFPVPATRQYIFSVHTAVHSKGTAAFFYSTYFCLFPKQNTKRHIIFITGVPDTLPVRFFCAFRCGNLRLSRSRAPPFWS